MQDFYENLERQYEEIRQRLQQLKYEIDSYDTVMGLLKTHIDDNIHAQKHLSADDREVDCKIAALRESFEKAQAKYERFRKAMIEREDEHKRLQDQKNELEVNLSSFKSWMAEVRKIEHIQGDAEAEKVSAFDYDVETINFLNECNWYLGQSCDRALAETLLACFPSGTFLVRSSRSHEDSYVLSVVANSAVRHCLIIKVDDKYCFNPPHPQRQYYSSLCNLVMDYRHQSLHVHHPELRTNLVYPLLSQLKKTSKK